jgi:peroxin-5
MAKWESEFSQLMNAQREELEDYGTNMQKAWEGGVGGYDGASQGIKFDGEGIPILGDYPFGMSNVHLSSPIHSLVWSAEKNNKYLESSSRSYLSDAKQLLEGNGSLSEAALMLEAAIQRGEYGEGGFETWILLGETRNMDEREEAGMRALLEGVRIAEQAGAPGAGMLVSRNLAFSALIH